jgi:hypothetical protein
MSFYKPPSAMNFLFQDSVDIGNTDTINTNTEVKVEPVEIYHYDLSTINLDAVSHVEKHAILRQACKEGRFSLIKILTEEISLQLSDLKNAILYFKTAIVDPQEDALRSLIFIYHSMPNVTDFLSENDLIFLIESNIMNDEKGILTLQLLSAKKFGSALKLWEKVPTKNSSVGNQVIKELQKHKLLASSTDPKMPSLKQLLSFCEKNHYAEEKERLNSLIARYREAHDG